MKLSVVIPAHNEEESVAEILEGGPAFSAQAGTRDQAKRKGAPSKKRSKGATRSFRT